MSTLFLALLGLPGALTGPVETLFVKVGPAPVVAGRSPGQERAVVLIHGLGLSLVPDKVSRPHLRSWQTSDSVLVKDLARIADVYSLSYGQTISCDRISDAPLLLQHLRNLKNAGYREIVLVGHSAGGLIARHIVEDHPETGVTKVIQVCSPNSGSGWAALKAVRSVQIAFLASLTHSARERILKERIDKRLPPAFEFACIVGSARVGGDGVVSCRSQWSPDLQAQGVPAYALRANHLEAMRSARAAELIVRLVKERQKRWDAATVLAVRKKLLGG